MKYMVLVLLAGALFGCATPLETCKEDNYWQEQGYNSIQQCARAVAEDRRNRWSAVSENLSNRKSFGDYYESGSANNRAPSSEAIMSCGMKPMLCYSKNCACIGGQWQTVSQ